VSVELRLQVEVNERPDPLLLERAVAAEGRRAARELFREVVGHRWPSGQGLGRRPPAARAPLGRDDWGCRQRRSVLLDALRAPALPPQNVPEIGEGNPWQSQKVS